jgi:histidinol phosphatase-like enzyme
MIHEFNEINSSIKFTIEQQTQNKRNYLDLTIISNQNGITFEIYRKPTTTCIIIHNTSCHLFEHKKSAIKYLYKRMETYNIAIENKKKEESTIKQMLKNNEYIKHKT